MSQFKKKSGIPVPVLAATDGDFAILLGKVEPMERQAGVGGQDVLHISEPLLLVVDRLAQMVWQH